LRINASDGLDFRTNVSEVGAQAWHHSSGRGLFLQGTHSAEEGFQVQFGPRQNNYELGLINDRIFGFGVSKYFIGGGGIRLESNLSGMLRHLIENDGWWQACE